MADDTTPLRTDVRAGGLLDLSTGPPAPPAPPPPRPPVVPDPEVRAGRTLDLSVKPAGTSPRKAPVQDFGGGLVLRETVDLSTRRPPAETPAAPSAPAAKNPRSKRGAPREDARGGSGPRTPSPRGSSRMEGPRDAGDGRSKGEAPPSASSSLADLLDPDVLAKLRGG